MCFYIFVYFWKFIDVLIIYGKTFFLSMEIKSQKKEKKKKNPVQKKNNIRQSSWTRIKKLAKISLIMYNIMLTSSYILCIFVHYIIHCIKK